MFQYFKNKISQSINQVIQARFDGLASSIDKDILLSGKQLGEQNFQFRQEEILSDLKLAEFSVYSQWGDDGIINFLTKYLDIENKFFIEFGVENYTECNTRFLLANDNWSGFIMDGSEENIASVKKDSIFWRYDLRAESAFVTKENINQLLQDQHIVGEIGLLHIDIDGNDYWIWKEIKNIDPVIVIVEYNSVFGVDKSWTIPYFADFQRSNYHYSNLYWGASIAAFNDLATDKGYSFVGCNSNGNNAYFVKTDKLKDLKSKTIKEGFVVSKFKEARNQNGELSFLRGNERLNILKGLEIFNTQTQKFDTI